MKIIFYFLFIIVPIIWPTISLANELDDIRKLTRVVEHCVERRDTRHPVFHGCVDWHSSVHGHWALLWAAHRLNDQALAHKVLQRFTTEGLIRELENLKKNDSGHVFFEMPYGRAWFLQLARDTELLYGSSKLRPLADYIFTSLLDYARKNGGEITATDYKNASWYLYQILEWSRFVKNEIIANEIKQLIYQRIKIHQQWPDFQRISGFFDPKALAVLVLGTADSKSETFMALANNYENSAIKPMLFPLRTAHQGGLNYSRSWGLWALAGLTGNAKFYVGGDTHTGVMINAISVWGNDYRRYAHWVAQFGLFSDRIKNEYVDSVE